jgi:hypothetical protein
MQLKEIFAGFALCPSLKGQFAATVVHSEPHAEKLYQDGQKTKDFKRLYVARQS